MRKLMPVALVLVVLLARRSAAAQAPADDGRGNPRAPDFTGATGWLNTDNPISIDDLKGQVVILDFWTYCCINCMHVFPDLKFIEEKYKGKPVVVIGVHSGKFDEEKDEEHIKNAVLRHNLSHPVAIDNDYMIWNRYGAHAWPTLMLIDPEGFLVGSTSGEGHRNDLDNAVQILLEMHGKKGTLGKPLTFRTEREKFQSGTLEFPGKVLADTKGKRLFVADTNHHRVLVSDFDGKVSMVIGQGKIGLKDGAFDSTEFHQPQGMALSEDGNTLYVADTENHAVREIDLQKKRVTTAAGTGKQAIHIDADGPGKATPLSSPWDLARVGNKLYIAMAGSHQIWVMDLPGNRVGVYSGTGREAAIDGPAKTSAFAQPSGLATDGKTLYVADSEASTVRSVDLAADGAVTSLAGSKQLFGFGLKDGPAPEARFQHPLGVALGEGDHAGTLYVADTFNGVIRTIDRESGEVKTWLGPDKSGKGNGTEAKPFFEPGGLSIAGNTLYVADTNHHRIVAVDLNAKTMRVLDVTLPPAPKRSK